LIFVASENAQAIRAFEVAGYEVKPFSEFTPGEHAIIVVPEKGTDTLELEKISSLGVPVVLVAGIRNAEGIKREKMAGMCGIPNQCVLFLDNGSVVDGTGKTIGPALRGTGISARVVVELAEQAIKEHLVPEIPVWEASGQEKPEEEPAIYETDEEENQKIPETTNHGAPQNSNQQTPLAQWLEQQISLADKVVMVFGIRPGVGASTTAAGLAGILADNDSLYVEISDSLIGYTFFGPSTDDAVNSGRYIYCGSKGAVVEPKKCGVLIAEIGLKDAASILYDKADFVVVVTDGTPPAFQRTGAWINGGWRTDILVVNKVFSGAGFPPEVYAGEYGLENILGIPGGPEEEIALHTAQTQGKLPFGHSVDFDTAFTKLGETVLNALGRKEMAGC